MHVRMNCSRMVWILIVMAVFTGVADAKFIGTTENENCIRSEFGTECEMQTSFTLAVSYGLPQHVDGLTTVPPQQPFGFEISKSEPIVEYPLRYLHTVAYYPTEEVVRRPHPMCDGYSIDCDDPNGFSIIRNPWELDGTFDNCLFRGEELFAQPSNSSEPYSTQHALKDGQLYFHGYEIGRSVRGYEISTQFQLGSFQYTATFAPDRPIYSTRFDEAYDEETFHFEAQLVGDMDPYTGVPELDNYILYIPGLPAGHPYVDNYQHNMLLVPREEVTRDGTEINKVGLSTLAFKRLKKDYTISAAGDGLANQLYHKHTTDIQRVQNSNGEAETTWLVTGKKAFDGDWFHLPDDDEMVLKHQIKEINHSLVHYTITQASGLRYIQSESEGIILDAWTEDFKSMSEDGTCSVTIKNIGNITASYVVTLTDATTNILKNIPAQARTLEPQEEVTLTFDISTVYNLDTTNQVLVSLKSPYGRLYDSVWCNFDTEEHPTTPPQDLMMPNEGTQTVVGADPDAPVITLAGDNPMTVTCGDEYVEPGATAVDTVDGAVPVAVGGDTVDPSTPGTYAVAYTAQDAACNIAQATRTVTVVGPCPEPLVGDNDDDGDVDMTDLSRMAQNWLVGT